MPKFKVGDHVERIGSLVPEYMRSGIVTRVIPNQQGHHLLTCSTNMKSISATK
jgi:hypothetical protein